MPTHGRLLLVAEPAAVENAIEDVECARLLAAVRLLESDRQVADPRELLQPRNASRERVQLVLGEGRALDVLARGGAQRADEGLLELAHLGLVRRREVLGGEECAERARRGVEHVRLRVLEQLLGHVVPQRLVRLHVCGLSAVQSRSRGGDHARTETCWPSR